MSKKPDVRSFTESKKLRHSDETDKLLAEFNKTLEAFLENRLIHGEDEDELD